MEKAYTFDDVVISPRFSEIDSRSLVEIKTNLGDKPFGLPVMSANMDTVTESDMAKAMAEAGGVGCLHRFQSIENNVQMYLNSPKETAVSFGLGGLELERARALYDAGASTIILDVAHGAQMAVVRQVQRLREIVRGNAQIIVGNFASANSVRDFLHHASAAEIDVLKVGIGSGAVCSTRVKTGVGIPQLSAICNVYKEIKGIGIGLIADGGIKSGGDVVKALAAGANMVMIGSMLSGTDEAPGHKVWKGNDGTYLNEKAVFPMVYDIQAGFQLNKDYPVKLPVFKKYRGSASRESYEVQNKAAAWRAAEGESTYVPYKGAVKTVLQDIEGGLRSGMTYVGAGTLGKLRANTEFVQVTAAGFIEGTPHGVRK